MNGHGYFTIGLSNHTYFGQNVTFISYFQASIFAQPFPRSISAYPWLAILFVSFFLSHRYLQSNAFLAVLFFFSLLPLETVRFEGKKK